MRERTAAGSADVCLGLRPPGLVSMGRRVNGNRLSVEDGATGGGEERSAGAAPFAHASEGAVSDR